MNFADAVADNAVNLRSMAIAKLRNDCLAAAETLLRGWLEMFGHIEHMGNGEIVKVRMPSDLDDVVRYVCKPCNQMLTLTEVIEMHDNTVKWSVTPRVGPSPLVEM